MSKKLEWNAFNHNLEWFNIFDSYSFMNDLYRIKTNYIKSKITLEDFKEEVRKSLSWQYRGRCEYELILTTWPVPDKEIKIDVYNQVMLNFDRFFDYLLNNIKLIKKVK